MEGACAPQMPPKASPMIQRSKIPTVSQVHRTDGQPKGCKHVHGDRGEQGGGGTVHHRVRLATAQVLPGARHGHRPGAERGAESAVEGRHRPPRGPLHGMPQCAAVCAA